LASEKKAIGKSIKNRLPAPGMPEEMTPIVPPCFWTMAAETKEGEERKEEERSAQ
jgi:hypothetical protein